MAEHERKGAVTFHGSPLTLLGPELKAGDKAPEFKALASDLGEVTLAGSSGKTRLISVVPSLDTPVCDLQTKRFNEEASRLPNRVVVLTVSVDLPFAQARWCGSVHADKIQVISDHRDLSFGKAYGTLIKELRLLSLAVFVVGPDDKIRYAEYVKEITSQPDYDRALQAVKAEAAV